jgi:hypothetical protein
MMASLSRQSRRGRMLGIMNLIFPITLVIFAIARPYHLSAVILFGVGIVFIPQFSLCNMLLQSIIPDDLRGRVMSVYTLIIFGGSPIGGILSTAIAERLDAPLAIVITALCMGVATILLNLMIPESGKLD